MVSCASPPLDAWLLKAAAHVDLMSHGSEEGGAEVGDLHGVGPRLLRVNEDEAIGNRPFLERSRRDTPYLDINLDYIEESDGGPMGAVKGFDM